jgi:hypothetical protein
MSRIYFHSTSDTLAIAGAERAHAAVLCERLAATQLDCLWEDPMLDFLKRTGWQESKGSITSSCLWLHGDESVVLPNGAETERWLLGLNTAMAVGNDIISLLAHMHAQCEIHGWVRGSNRWWLARLIDSGRAMKILRPDMGWEELSTFLKSSADEPVVTSYSVTDQFPNQYIAHVPEENHEWWSKQSVEDQWRMAMEGLKTQNTEWKPNSWRYPHKVFGAGYTLFDLRNMLGYGTNSRCKQDDTDGLGRPLFKETPNAE